MKTDKEYGELWRDGLVLAVGMLVFGVATGLVSGRQLFHNEPQACYDNCPCIKTPPYEATPNPVQAAMQKIEEGEAAKQYLRRVDEQYNGPPDPDIMACEKDCKSTALNCERLCQTESPRDTVEIADALRDMSMGKDPGVAMRMKVFRRFCEEHELPYPEDAGR